MSESFIVKFELSSTTTLFGGIDLKKEKIAKKIRDAFNRIPESIILSSKKTGKEYLFLEENFLRWCEDFVNEDKVDKFESFYQLIGELVGCSTQTFRRILYTLGGPKMDRKVPEETCIEVLEGLEKIFKKRFLQEYCNQPFEAIANKYIHTLVEQLLKMILTADYFNYLEYSKYGNFECYKNHLRMIEENISTLFGDENVEFKIWHEILSPIKEIIYNGSFPGIKKGIWVDTNANLKYFDCVYEIARLDKDIYLAWNLERKFSFSIGETEWEINESLKNQEKYFEKKLPEYSGDEKKLFANELLSTYREIVKEQFEI